MDQLPAISQLPQTPAAYPLAVAPNNNAGVCLAWGWVLAVGTCLLSLVPLLGILVWFIGFPLLLAALVLSIVALAQGRTTGGVLLMLFCVTIAPLMTVFGPVVSTFLAAALAAAFSGPPL